jgi:hypothetical protein
MSTDEKMSMWLQPLPVVCGLIGQAVTEPGFRSGQCSRCRRHIWINRRVEQAHADAGVECVAVCTGCWSAADQAVVRSYRDMLK